MNVPPLTGQFIPGSKQSLLHLLHRFLMFRLHLPDRTLRLQQLRGRGLQVPLDASSTVAEFDVLVESAVGCFAGLFELGFGFEELALEFAVGGFEFLNS